MHPRKRPLWDVRDQLAQPLVAVRSLRRLPVDRGKPAHYDSRKVLRLSGIPL